MTNTFDALSQALAPDNIQELSNMTGLDAEKASSAVFEIVPALLKGLSENSNNESGAESLAHALDKDHSGSILDNVSYAFQNGDKAEDTGRDTNGIGIVNHIFGGKQLEVASQIGSKLGIDQSTIISLMGKLAPIVMGFLGKTKKDNNMSGTDLGGLLSMATSMLGGGSKNGGGDLMGSLFKMGTDFFGGKKAEAPKPENNSSMMDIGASILKGFLKK